jgi:hypothetical protein
VITEKKLAHMAKHPRLLSRREAIKSLKVLWRVARAAQTMDRLLCFGDRVYDVREREGKGWEGPLVREYAQASLDFDKALSSLPKESK